MLSPMSRCASGSRTQTDRETSCIQGCGSSLPLGNEDPQPPLWFQPRCLHRAREEDMRMLYLEAPRFFSPPTSNNGILWFTSEPAEDPNLGLTCLLSHLFMAFASHYVAETNRKNRLKAPLKPFIGILSGRNGPLIKSNDNIHHIPSAWYNGIIVKTSNTAGLYRNDLSKMPLTQVIQFGTPGVATLFLVQKIVPVLLSMRYSTHRCQRFSMGLD